MAVTRTDKTTKMTLKMEVSADTFKNRIFNHVNPAAVDTKVYEHGTALAGLSSDTLYNVIRTDVGTLVND